MKEKSHSPINNDFYSNFTTVAKSCASQVTPDIAPRQDRPWFFLNRTKSLQAIEVRNKASLSCRKTLSPETYKCFKIERSNVKRLVDDAKIM